jgi:hypothetical protein
VYSLLVQSVLDDLTRTSPRGRPAEVASVLELEDLSGRTSCEGYIATQAAGGRALQLTFKLVQSSTSIR